MRRLLLAICAVLALWSPAYATSFTSKATGNWSSGGQTTWNQVGVPGPGDTVSIGTAHTVTVDVNTTVGTSPNDTTTAVVTVGAFPSTLIVAAGVTFTVRGNVAIGNFGAWKQGAGSTTTLDNSSSGGTPSYKFGTLGNVIRYEFLGSAVSRSTIQAISGQTFQWVGSWWDFTATYMDVNRAASLTVGSIWAASGTGMSITDSRFTGCGLLDVQSSNTTGNFIFDRNTFSGGTDASSPVAQAFKISSGTFTSGTRRIRGNVFDLSVTYAGVNFSITDNYFGEAFDFVVGASASSFTGNLVNQSVTRAVSPSYRGTTAVSGNYFAYGTAGGNAHFLGATAAGGDLAVSGNIFEQTGTYATDVGDAVFPGTDGSARTITIDNNIVLPISFTGDTATSGTIATLFGTDATRTVKASHNTIAGANPANTAAINVAEGGSGHAGELAEWKSNLIWVASTSTQHSAARITGTTNGIITASGADYNFRWNVNIGDNGRGYDDYGGNLNLWTGAAASTGDAAAENVDNHGVVANPGFVDPTRNLATWSAYRGGAATTTAALAALRADPTLTGTSLIPWVTAGFAPTNPAYQGTAHDGTTPGAVPGVFFPALLIAP